MDTKYLHQSMFLHVLVSAE